MIESPSSRGGCTIWCVLAVAGLAALLDPSAEGQTADVDRPLFDKFVAECPSDQKACEDALAHLAGACTRTITKFPDDQLKAKGERPRTEVCDVRFAFNRECGGARSSITLAADPGWEQVWAENPNYGFRVSKVRVHPKYVVGRLWTPGEMAIRDEDSGSLADRIWTIGELRALFAFEDVVFGKLRYLASSRAYRVVSFRQLSDGSGWISLECERDIAKSGTCPAFVYRVSLVIDPSFHWSIRSITTRALDVTGSPYATSARITYQSDQALPIPSRIEQELRDSHDRLCQASTYVFGATSYCTEPVADFRLEKYGLASPGPVRGKRTFYALLNAAVLLTLGVALFIVARRRRVNVPR